VNYNVLPSAESVVFSGDSDLELIFNPEHNIDVTLTDFLSFDFSQEQQNDPDIARFYYILNNDVILINREFNKSPRLLSFI
jgi:hypothetical protein